jgi:hypothetical protein
MSYEKEIIEDAPVPEEGDPPTIPPVKPPPGKSDDEPEE